jgi:SAM-dependent methyltransferase
MGDRHWQIGVCGTFDVANYADLLFPVIAESELTERLGPLTLHRFSYGAKTPPDWPYEVTSVADLPAKVRALDGMLIGGGFLIRFDKDVAPGYLPPVPRIHHPTGYWLTPALVALQHDVPVLPPDTYDLIFSCHSFHHFMALERIMAEVHAALTQDGLFVRRVPAHFLRRRLAGIAHLGWRNRLRDRGVRRRSHVVLLGRAPPR